jgi:hypothetical protein
MGLAFMTVESLKTVPSWNEKSASISSAVGLLKVAFTGTGSPSEGSLRPKVMDLNLNGCSSGPMLACGSGKAYLRTRKLSI